ncbi:hypothetical protein [Niastella vici]|nr:hypothetical protein [Niastella vici]
MKTIVMIVVCATAYMACTKMETGGINYFGDGQLYYWFDTNGKYLRENSLLYEVEQTGYNNNPDNPKTIAENGYSPVNCCITDSAIIPIDADMPDERLYSHP